MTRKRHPSDAHRQQGARVVVPLSLAREVRDALDRVRGDESRSRFVERVLLEACPELVVRRSP